MAAINSPHRALRERVGPSDLESLLADDRFRGLTTGAIAYRASGPVKRQFSFARFIHSADVTMDGMNLPRFTLRDMFVATTLIAVGIGGGIFTVRYLNTHKDAGSSTLFVLLACVAVIGAGIGTPFHQKWAGAGIAILVLVAAFVVAIVCNFFSFHG